MYSSPDCPRCGMSLEPFHTKFHEPFDTYWRCPYCHYSCNADLSRTDWHNIIANEVDWYAKQSVACKDKLNRYIHIGMDEADGMALILKFHNEFLNTTKDLHDNLSTLLSRSNKQTFRAKLDTVYGLTSYNFAKACTLLEQYKPAAQYIDEAMHYVPSDNVYFSTVLSLAEEIRQKNQVAITARPADTTPALSAAPAPAATPPTPADKPGPPSKEESIFFPGCLVWLVFMPLVLLICIYHGIDMLR